MEARIVHGCLGSHRVWMPGDGDPVTERGGEVISAPHMLHEAGDHVLGDADVDRLVAVKQDITAARIAVIAEASAQGDGADTLLGESA